MDAKTLGRLRGRFFRTTPKHPEGAFGHHGDCEIFRVDVCTCGLLHDLLPLAPDTQSIFPDFWPQWNKHQAAIDGLFEKRSGPATPTKDSPP